MSLEATFRFERDNAKAMLAAETDKRKRKALAERVAHYTRQLQRIQQEERGTDE